MKKLALLIPTLAFTAWIVSSCGHSNVAGPSMGASGNARDQALVAPHPPRQPQFVEDGFYESPDPMTTALGASAGGVFSVQDTITPITFWRTIRHVERTFEFAFSDTDTTGHPTTAILTIHKTLTGSFNIQVEDTTGGFNRSVIHKPLEDHWVRKLLFKRLPTTRGDEDGDDDDETDGGSGDDEHGFWRLAGLTGVDVTSKGVTTHIVSLKFEGAGLDTTITDPLKFFRLRNVLRVEPMMDVTITATTEKPDDIVLLLSRDHRFRLKPNGDNTYTGTFKTPFVMGCRHFGVNALSHGTLYDSQAPYDSQTWILPFLVVGSPLAAMP